MLMVQGVSKFTTAYLLSYSNDFDSDDIFDIEAFHERWFYEVKMDFRSEDTKMQPRRPRERFNCLEEVSKIIQRQMQVIRTF
jgi:hypothetical protein